MLLKAFIFIIITAFFGADIVRAAELYQDGPNCFNTSLLTLGYTKNTVYSSEDELLFFVDNFCKPLKNTSSSSPLQRLILFQRLSVETGLKTLIHSAVSLGNNQIIEKYSLLGILNEAREDDPNPGIQITHQLSESLYSAKKSQPLFGEIYEQDSYVCQNAEQVQTALLKLAKNPAIGEQLEFRKVLAKQVNIADRKIIEENIMKQLLPLAQGMQWDRFINKTPQSSLEKTYLLGLLRSNAYQFRLLICAESLKMGDECYAPQIQKAVEVNNAWYEKIYSLDN